MAEENLLKKRRTKYITELPSNEKCVSMVEFDGTIFVATERRVYFLKGGTNILKPLEFEVPE